MPSEKTCFMVAKNLACREILGGILWNAANNNKVRTFGSLSGYPRSARRVRRMKTTGKLLNMEPVILEHDELKLIGIPCISLKEMSAKYHHAKESLLSSTKYFPQVVNPQIHYGMWPNVETQSNPERHAYILCVEVSTFEGIPDWYVKLSVPAQKCVVVANDKGDFDAASKAVDAYIEENNLKVSAEGREYIICEKYNYDGEGFSRYSLPIVS